MKMEKIQKRVYNESKDKKKMWGNGNRLEGDDVLLEGKNLIPPANIQQGNRIILEPLTEKEMQKEIGILDEDVLEIEDPLFIAQVNFEMLKSQMCLDPGFFDVDENRRRVDYLEIIRFRDTRKGEFFKSREIIKVKDGKCSKKYVEMIDRIFGIETYAWNGYVFII